MLGASLYKTYISSRACEYGKRCTKLTNSLNGSDYFRTFPGNWNPIICEEDFRPPLHESVYRCDGFMKHDCRGPYHEIEDSQREVGSRWPQSPSESPPWAKRFLR